jgi:hypothetical protein
MQDDLLKRADAAIGESRWIRKRTRADLARARKAAETIKRILRLAHAEREHAAAALRQEMPGTPTATPNRERLQDDADRERDALPENKTALGDSSMSAD